MGDFQQHIRFCTTSDGVRIAYATSGSGPPLVRVASWLTHLDLDWKGPLRKHWFQEFSNHYTLIRFDQRGTGLSDRNVPDQSINGWVKDLEAVVNDLGLDKFMLLGLCQGGAIAVKYAVLHPSRVKRLIIYDSYRHGALTKGAPAILRKQAEALTQMIKVGWGSDTKAFRKIFADLLMPSATEDQRNWLSELQRKTVTPEMAAILWRAYHAIDIDDITPRVEAPSLVFHVTGDKIVPFDEGRKLACSIPNARFVPLEGENHILLEDDPAWTRFLAELHSFTKVQGLSDEPCNSRDTFPELTPRECEVLELIARGMDNGQIAQTLYISPKTVRNHIYRIFSKLQVNSRAKAIILAREAGLGKGEMEFVD